jgi:hypothetical protein
MEGGYIMKKLNMLTILISLLFLTITSVAGAAILQVPEDFITIQAAIDNASDGDTIRVGPGAYAGAFVTKRVEIKGEGGAIINTGPMHPAGLSMGFRLLAGSDGATISHLVFKVDLAIMNGAAVDDVTVTQCTFENTIQAISNWCGDRWEISHNKIYDLRTRNGGGIGILIADFSGGKVTDNVVSHNVIMGTLHVDSNDGGGYDGSGIVIYADFRWGGAGTKQMSGNRVVKNKISLVSDSPTVVDVHAFELTDTRDNVNADPYPVIHGNAIGFNDFRRTVSQIALTPIELGDENEIDRNLGDNRGHGLHNHSK